MNRIFIDVYFSNAKFMSKFGFPVYFRNELKLYQHCKASGATVGLLVELPVGGHAALYWTERSRSADCTADVR